MRRIWTPFIQLCAVGLLARFSYQMARSPVLPRFAQDLGATPQLIGFILGASTITGIFIKLPAGALSDVLGRKRMLLLGILFFAVPPFLYPLVQEPIGLLFLRFLHGFATAIFSPVTSAAVADLFQEDRGERLGSFTAVGELGSTLGPVLGGFLLFSTNSFTTIYLTVGFLGLLAFLLATTLPLQENTAPAVAARPDRWKQFRSGVLEVVDNRAVLIASGAEACLFLGVGALVGFLPLYAKGKGSSDAHVGLILGAQVVTAMLGKPLTGRLSDRVGRKPMILLGLTLCAGVLPIVALVGSFGMLFALGTLFGLGMAIVTPSTTALVADLCQSGRYGAAMGVFGSILDIGEASGPILAGFLIASLGYFPTFALIAALMAAVTFIFASLVRDPQPPTNGVSVKVMKRRSRLT